MPQGAPAIGETWSTQAVRTDAPPGQPVLGVVAEVVSNVITMVSFTGSRLRFPPDRFLASWVFHSDPPLTFTPCSVAGCAHQAIFYVASTSEPFCPRHMPTGVQALPVGSIAALLDQNRAIAATMQARRVIPPCPLCQNDRLVNIPGPALTQPGLMFRCDGCNARMAFRLLSPYDHTALARDFRTLEIEGLSVREVHVSPGFYSTLLRGEPSVDFRPGENRVRIFNVPVAINMNVTDDVHVFLVMDNSRAVRLDTPPRLQVRPKVDSQWVNKISGTIVTVSKLVDDVVYFHTQGNPSTMLTVGDFYQYFRPIEAKEREPRALPDVKPGEEWERVGDPQMGAVRIVERNDALRTVTVEDTATGTRLSLRLVEMAEGRWKKVTRTTVYDRLTREDDF